MLTNYQMRTDYPNLVLELKHSKTNCQIIGTYKLLSLSDITFTSEIKHILTFYRSTHDTDILPMGDFNMTLDNSNFNESIEDLP